MQALLNTQARLTENYSSLRVRVKNKPVIKTVPKSTIIYPRINMPEQPSGYIKPRQHECW